MNKLIKQIFFSIKSSLLIIFSLIIISALTIFTAFSAIYLNSNISNSINDIRSKGNASDIIVNKQYNSTNANFNYIKTKNGFPVVSGKKDVWVSAFNYQTPTSTNFYVNTIFPYKNTDFTKKDINSDLTKMPDSPSYFDRYQNRYSLRKKGMLKVSSFLQAAAGNTGVSTNYRTSIFPYRTWTGVSYSFSDTDTQEKVSDPNYIIFEENPNTGKPPILNGYFKDGNISNQIELRESFSYPSSSTFDGTNKLGINVVNYDSTHKNLKGLYNLDLNEAQSKFTYYYGDLLDVLKNNVKKESVPFYRIEIDKSSLKGIDKYIYNKLINDPKNPLYNEFIKIIQDDFIIKDSWILDYKNANVDIASGPNADEKIIEFFLNNRIDQLQNLFKDFISKHRDNFIEIVLKNKNINYSNENSFNFYDRDSKINYLVSGKENNNINKIILNSGVNIETSQDYKNFYNTINNEFSITSIEDATKNSSFNGLRKLVEYIASPNSVISSVGYDKQQDELKDLANALLKAWPSTGIVDLDNININWMIKKLFAILSSPSLIKDEYQNIDIVVGYNGGLSSINSPVIFSYKEIENYKIVLSDKYLNNSNKEIFPLNSNDPNDINTWNYFNKNRTSSTKNSKLIFDDWLNKIDDKYKMEFNNKQFIISGSGISPENAYPITSITSPIPNPSTDILLYANMQGYKTILKYSLNAAENNYFSIFNPDINLLNTNLFIDDLNKTLAPIMNGNTSNVCLNIDTPFISNNILSLRYSFPDIVKNNVSIISTVIVLILAIISLYFFYIILKNYINKNKVPLSICKANGFSTLKIAFSFISMILIISLLGGIVGYLLGFFLQGFIFSIFSPYMFIEILFRPFSFIGFFGSFFYIAIIAFVFIFINLKILFKKPLSQIMSQTVEIKANKILSITKYKSNIMSSNSKFKIALSMSNISRTLFYLLACSLGIVIFTISLSFSEKFNTSKRLTDLNKNFVYSVDLTTPNDQSGLYKTQLNYDIGTSNSKIGINSIYPLTNADINSSTLPYAAENMKVLEYVVDSTGVGSFQQKLDQNKQPIFFSNIVLPSYQMYTSFLKDPNILRNTVFTKWLLDITIPFLNINVWDTIKPQIPSELVSRIETQGEIFMNTIANHEIIGPIFQKDFGIKENNSWKVDGSKVINLNLLNPTQSSLSDEFITFVGKVYGFEELAKIDTKLCYGINTFDKMTDETYTYVDFIFKNKKLNSISKNSVQKIIGIKPNSSFINLKNNNGEFIGNKLDQNENNIIINNGASLKYKLNVGDKIDLQVLNSYYRFSEKMLNLDQDKNNSYVFNVVDIASTSFGEEFYISQNKANEITQLKNGKFVSTVELDKVSNMYKKIEIGPSNSQEFYNIPYNGLFTKSSSPSILSTVLSNYSLINIYGNFYKLDASDKNTVNILSNTPNQLIFESIVTNNNNLINEYARLNNKSLSYSKNDLIKELSNANTSTEQIILFLNKWFGDIPMSANINNISNYQAISSTYSTLIDTFSLVQILLVSLIMPIIIIVIFIMSHVMLNEIKNMISILKTLGYSDRKNIFNIVYTFISIYIISAVIAILFIFLISILMQWFTYTFTSIFISSAINFTNYIYSAILIFGILLLSFIVTIIKYKKIKLNDSIKYNI